jgi:protein-S-isoprenylcysteine O-methyltransferase Ste14
MAPLLLAAWAEWGAAGVALNLAGLLLAFIGVALARGEWRGILGVLLAAAAFWRKLRIEERWMQEHFGNKYQTYSRRVSALIPFVI